MPVGEHDEEWKTGKAGLTRSSNVAVVCEDAGVGNLNKTEATL